MRLFDDRRKSRVVAVADLDENRLAQVADRFPDARTTTDAASILTADDVDAVAITTPTSTHYELAKAALNAGKHVFVEKPITSEVEHARDLVQLAEEKNLTLMVGHVFLFNAAVRRTREEIESGSLGTIQYISMVRTNLGPIRMDVNAAWDLAAHDISIANYWLDAEPYAVSATAGTWINEGVADAVFATLKYPGNVLVNLHVSWLHPRKSRDITVVGEQKMLTFDDNSLTEPLRVYDKGVTDERRAAPFVDSFASFRASVRDGDILIPKVAAGEPLGSEVAHFIASIEDGSTPVTSGRVGLAVVAALEAIQKSIAADGAQQPVEQVAEVVANG